MANLPNSIQHWKRTSGTSHSLDLSTIASHLSGSRVPLEAPFGSFTNDRGPLSEAVADPDKDSIIRQLTEKLNESEERNRELEDTNKQLLETMSCLSKAATINESFLKIENEKLRSELEAQRQKLYDRDSLIGKICRTDRYFSIEDDMESDGKDLAEPFMGSRFCQARNKSMSTSGLSQAAIERCSLAAAGLQNFKATRDEDSQLDLQREFDDAENCEAMSSASSTEDNYLEQKGYAESVKGCTSSKNNHSSEQNDLALTSFLRKGFPERGSASSQRRNSPSQRYTLTPRGGTASSRGGTASSRGGTASSRGCTASSRGGTASLRGGTASPEICHTSTIMKLDPQRKHEIQGSPNQFHASGHTSGPELAQHSMREESGISAATFIQAPACYQRCGAVVQSAAEFSGRQSTNRYLECDHGSCSVNTTKRQVRMFSSIATPEEILNNENHEVLNLSAD